MIKTALQLIVVKWLAIVQWLCVVCVLCLYVCYIYIYFNMYLYIFLSFFRRILTFCLVNMNIILLGCHHNLVPVR